MQEEPAPSLKLFQSSNNLILINKFGDLTSGVGYA
jgi:hypothetical protein